MSSGFGFVDPPPTEADDAPRRGYGPASGSSLPSPKIGGGGVWFEVEVEQNGAARVFRGELVGSEWHISEPSGAFSERFSADGLDQWDSLDRAVRRIRLAATA